MREALFGLSLRLEGPELDTGLTMERRGSLGCWEGECEGILVAGKCQFAEGNSDAEDRWDPGNHHHAAKTILGSMAVQTAEVCTRLLQQLLQVRHLFLLQVQACHNLVLLHNANRMTSHTTALISHRK